MSLKNKLKHIDIPFLLIIFFISVYGIILTFIFKNIETYSPTNSIDAQYYFGLTLTGFNEATLNNSVSFLLVNLIFVFTRRNKNFVTTESLFNFLIFLLFVGLIFFNQYSPLFNYLFSHEEKGHHHWHDFYFRYQFFFHEPSVAGSFIAALLGYYLKRNILHLKVTFLTAMGVLTFSTSFIVGLFIQIFWKIVTANFEKYSKIILLLIFSSITCLALYYELKTNSGSVRLYSLLHVTELLKATYGFGVGFGNYRSGSFLVTIIGSLGVVGFFYCIFLIRLLIKLNKTDYFNFLVVFFLLMSLGLSDWVYPFFFYILGLGLKQYDVKNQETSRTI